MKHWLCLLVCGALTTLALAQDFTATLTPAERAAAGLERLSAAELAALKAVVERYKAGEVAEVQQQAASAVVAAREEAEARRAAPPAATPPPAAAEASSVKRTNGPSWVAGLVSSVRRAPGSKEDDTLHSRLVGEFRGWTKGTIFTLENGQRWQVSGSDAYNTPPVAAPAVRIKPGAFNSFWMAIEGAGPSVRVRPYQIE